jgi:CRP-like cAMP-binding protein
MSNGKPKPSTANIVETVFLNSLPNSTPQIIDDGKISGKHLWKKAIGKLRTVGSFKLTAVSCATCSIENIMSLFEEKAEKRGQLVGGQFLYKFCTELRQMVPLFLEGVSMEVFEQVCLSLTFLYHEPEERLMSVGDKPDGWYFIVAGSVAVFANDDDIHNINKRLGVIKAGVGFGELGFLTDDAVRNATITATAPHGVYTFFVPKDVYVDHLIRFNKKNDNIVDTQHFLRKAQMLHWLDSRALIQLAHSVVVREVEAFDTYHNQGDTLDEVFVVQTGFIKLIQRVGTMNCTLAILGPGDIGGISDLIVSLCRKKNDAFCRCSYKTEGQPAKLLAIRRYAFEQTVLSTLRPLIEDLVKIRLVWESMRVRHKQRHPGTHMEITKNMMETYGYTRGPASEMVQKRRRTQEEDEARNLFYHIGSKARQLARSVGVGPDMVKQNRSTETKKVVQAFKSTLKSSSSSMEKEYKHLDVVGRLRLAHEMYSDAVKHAKVARLGREASIASSLGEQCLQAMVLEDFKSLRIQARNLTQTAHLKVAEVIKSIDPRLAEESSKEMRLKKIALAKKCDHKVMVAFSTWMRTSKKLREYMKMNPKIKVKKDLIECERQIRKLKLLMHRLTIKKNELTSMIPAPVKIRYNSASESDSSEDDMSMYITSNNETMNRTLNADESMNDTIGIDLQLNPAEVSNYDAYSKELDKSIAELQWNMQGTAVPIRTIETNKKKYSHKQQRPTTPKEGGPAKFSKSPNKQRRFQLHTKNVQNLLLATAANTKSMDNSKSTVSILPRPISKHRVNMHVMVCESNIASGKLLKFLMEGEARRNLNLTCVVDLVSGPFKREEENPIFIQQHKMKHGSLPNGFTFVVLDLGNVFVDEPKNQDSTTKGSMTCMRFQQLPKSRRKKWIQRLYNQKEQMIEEAKKQFKTGTPIFVTINEPGWEHLLQEMCTRKLVQGIIRKPYTAMNVRWLLQENNKK